MKKYLFFAAIAIAALVSCKKEIAKEEVAVKPGYVQLTLTAQCDVDSKASLNGKQVVWEVGEKVAVFTPASVEPNEFSVTGVEGTTVKIWGEVPDGTTSFVAAYPYENAVSWDKASVVNMKVDNQSVSSPTAPISVDPKALASVAYFADATATPTFKNTLALLKFSVGVDGVKKVKISADNSGALCGDVAVTVAADADPVVAGASIPSIEVACDEGFTKNAVYYAAVAPGDYEGFSVRSYVDGAVKQLSTTAAGSFKRNDVIDLGDVATNAKTVSMIVEITNAEELALFLANAPKYKADEVVKLMNDIDLTGATLTSAESFAGTFDGQGFSLKNWTSNGTALFAACSGTIKNFTIDASCSLNFPNPITSNFAFVVCQSSGTVQGITNNANATGTNLAISAGRVAVLVGQSASDTEPLLISDCVNNGNVTITIAEGGHTATSYVSTIVASIGGKTTQKVLQDCINSGNISVTDPGTNASNYYFGGVAGGTTDGCDCLRVKNEGDVSLTVKYMNSAFCLAGVTSYASGNITGCENTGDVTFTSDSAIKGTFISGIAGYFSSRTMSGCVNRGDISVTAGYIKGRNNIGDLKGTLSYNGTNGISAGLSAGGLVSASGRNVTMTDCENFGDVTVLLNDPFNTDIGTHTAARPSFGGCVGDFCGPITNVKNHGKVSVSLDNNGVGQAGSNGGYMMYVGGIIGSGYNWSGASTSGGSDTNKNNKLALTNCENTGDVYLHSEFTRDSNSAVGGIAGWPQSEDKTAVYVADGCKNSGTVTIDGLAKVRAGGIHGGTGRMKNCENTGDVVFVAGAATSVIGGIAGFQSQGHIVENCKAECKVEAKATVNAVGGIIANQGNVEVETGAGCEVNCELIGGPATATGLIVGVMNGNTKNITYGTVDAPIKVCGSVNGTTVDATNFETLICGSKNRTDGVHTFNVDFQPPVFVEDLANNKFTYHGKEYPIVKLADGRWWMAAPMAYVPEGKTVSSDPVEDAGIWYTYTTDGTNTTASTDFKDGYLYDYPTAFGVAQDAITYGTRDEYKAGTVIGNFRDFEGVQGICPPGWYIPTRADFLKLVGASNKDDSLPTPETAAVADASAVYWVAAYSGSNIPTFNDAGWNFAFLGVRAKASLSQTGAYNKTATKETTCSVSEWVGKPALNQVMCSTPYMPNTAGNNVQYFCMMSAFTAANPLGKLSLSYGNYLHGMELRCIRKAD